MDLIRIAIDFRALSNFFSICYYRPESEINLFPYRVELTIDGKKRILEIYSDVYQGIIGSNIYPEVDILIGSDNTAYENKAIRFIRRAHYKKTAIAKTLNEISKQLSLKNYRSIQAENFNKYTSFENRFVLLKPEQGAGGCDNFIIDTEFHNPKELLYTLRDLNTEDSILDFLNSYSSSISYFNGRSLDPDDYSISETNDRWNKIERHPLFAYVTKSTLNYSVQEIVTNIKKEYRVILDKNRDPFYIVPRLREKHTHPKLKESIFDFKQGYGEALLGAERLDVSLESVFSDPKDVLDFKRLTQQKCFEPVSSVDLFVCEDGKWGIFEFSPQFGLAEYPMETVFKWHMNYIKDLVEDYLSK